MGSPTELEVHAYFHNYHGKLKFVGSQLLKSRPDLPSCNQGLHSNNLVPEGPNGYVCHWEHCDVGFHLNNTSYLSGIKGFKNSRFFFLHRARLTILSGSTDMWTIMLKMQSHRLCHNKSRLSSVPGQVRLTKDKEKFQFSLTLLSLTKQGFCYRLRCLLQDPVPSERTHAEPHSGEACSVSYMWQHVLQQHKAV